MGRILGLMVGWRKGFLVGWGYELVVLGTIFFFVFLVTVGLRKMCMLEPMIGDENKLYYARLYSRLFLDFVRPD